MKPLARLGFRATCVALAVALAAAGCLGPESRRDSHERIPFGQAAARLLEANSSTEFDWNWSTEFELQDPPPKTLVVPALPFSIRTSTEANPADAELTFLMQIRLNGETVYSANQSLDSLKNEPHASYRAHGEDPPYSAPHDVRQDTLVEGTNSVRITATFWLDVRTPGQTSFQIETGPAVLHVLHR